MAMGLAAGRTRAVVVNAAAAPVVAIAAVVATGDAFKEGTSAVGDALPSTKILRAASVSVLKGYAGRCSPTPSRRSSRKVLIEAPLHRSFASTTADRRLCTAPAHAAGPPYLAPAASLVSPRAARSNASACNCRHTTS